MGESPKRLSIEQELEKAQQLGRWLADDELTAEAEQRAQQLAEAQHTASLRTRLTVLTVVCVLIPPLWPLALGLTMYLLFPRTAMRLFLAAGVGFSLVVLAGVGVSVGLLLWLISILV
ncbi:MAG: hypothetical protein VKK03_02860 [Synechococcus sp.]|nr:hypothetical protein [Synechococcus sp.]